MPPFALLLSIFPFSWRGICEVGPGLPRNPWGGYKQPAAPKQFKPALQFVSCPKISVLITFERTRILHSSREAAFAPSYDVFFDSEGHDFKIFYVGAEFLNVDDICLWWRWKRMGDTEAKLTIYADYVSHQMPPMRPDVERVTIYEWCSGQLQEDLHGQGLTLLAYSNLGLRKEVTAVAGLQNAASMPLQDLGFGIEENQQWLKQLWALPQRARQHFAVLVARALRAHEAREIHDVGMKMLEILTEWKEMDEAASGWKSEKEGHQTGATVANVLIVANGAKPECDETEVFLSLLLYHQFWEDRNCEVNSICDTGGLWLSDFENEVKQLSQTTRPVLVVAGEGKVVGKNKKFAWVFADDYMLFSDLWKLWQQTGCGEWPFLLSDTCYSKFLCEAAAKLRATCNLFFMMRFSVLDW